MSREYTQEEIKEMFMRQVWAMVDFWAREDRVPSPREKLEGLAFSFLNILDGGSGGFPACEVVVVPHESDKQYCIDHDENYFPELPEWFHDIKTIHGNSLLHEEFHSWGRKLGYLTPVNKK